MLTNTHSQNTRTNMPHMLKYLSVAMLAVVSCFTVTAQNTFPTSGKVGLGTTTPSKLLDVNGKSVFRDRAMFEGVLRYDFIKIPL